MPAAARQAGMDRRRFYAAVHAGAKALGWDDDLRRQVMAERYQGKTSSKDLTDDQLRDFARHIGRLQDAAKAASKHRQPKRAGKRALAPGAQASKARALWLSLYHLGAVADPAEAALDAWVERQTGVASLRFADQVVADQVIRGLRNWCDRVGFTQPDAAFVGEIEQVRTIARLEGGYGVAAKIRLIEAQRRLLQEPRLTDTWRMTADTLDRLIEELGRRVRAMRPRE